MWEALKNDPAALKRLVVTILTAVALIAAPLIAKYFGVVITDTQIEMIAGVIVAYILQSGARSISEARAAGKAAADKVADLGEAKRVLDPAHAPEEKP